MKPFNLLKSRSLFAVLLLIASILIYAFIFIRSKTSAQYILIIDPTELIFGLLILLCAINSVLIFLVKTSVRFRILLAIQALLFLVFINLFPDLHEAETILAVLVAAQAATYERFPINMVLCAVFLLITSVIRQQYLFNDESDDFLEIIYRQIDFVIVVGLFSVVGCLLTYFRETVTDFQNDVSQLEDVISELSMVNLSFQDYAKNAEERGLMQERLRLTRDIHDIVGYTLTNSIMMMEAAKLMAASEPEKIPPLMERARYNSEDGLNQIRSVLRDLREQEVYETSGFNAISKLIKIFSSATAVDVAIEFGNVNWQFTAEEGWIIYHFIQEGLINAFRHGRATKISISFWKTEEEYSVAIRDNGIGAALMKEGIGLSGMRERLSRLHGHLQFVNGNDGFRVTAYLPVQNMSRQEDNGIKEDQTAAG